jgi:hypothetical protein
VWAVNRDRGGRGGRINDRCSLSFTARKSGSFLPVLNNYCEWENSGLEELKGWNLPLELGKHKKTYIEIIFCNFLSPSKSGCGASNLI